MRGTHLGTCSWSGHHTPASSAASQTQVSTGLARLPPAGRNLGLALWGPTFCFRRKQG